MAYLLLGIIIGAVIVYFIMISKVHENDDCITNYERIMNIKNEEIESLKTTNDALKRLNDIQETLLSKKK